MACAGRRGEEVELVLDRELGLHDPSFFAALLLGAGDELGQAVIALRADHEVDDAGALDDLGAFGLGDAAGHRDHGLAALLLLLLPQAPELGIDLFGGLLADVAGVEDDEIGVLGRVRLDIALARQRVRHALGVIDVHLATEGLYVQLAGFAHRASIDPCRNS